MSTADIHDSKCSTSIHTDMSGAITEQCMDDERHWIVNELTKHMQISKTIDLQSLWHAEDSYEVGVTPVEGNAKVDAP